MSDIEGKVAREAMSECGQRVSFNISEFRFDHRRVSAEWRAAHGIDRSPDLNSFCA
jgi:hypothetical protein